MEISDLEKVNNAQSQKWYGTDIESVARAPGSANNYCDGDDDEASIREGTTAQKRMELASPI